MDPASRTLVISESSYLDGIIRYKDIDKIKEKGINAIAITDHGNLSGSYEFYKEAIKNNIKPIIGQEFYWAIDRLSKEKDELEKARPNYHMILLAKNQNGFKTLSHLSSRAYIDGFYYSPRIDDKLLEEFHEDIIGTSACLGSIVNQYLLKGFKDKAIAKLLYYKELFGPDNFFIELQPHNMEEQRFVNYELLNLSTELDIPIVVTSDSHYIDCCDKQLHDKFITIATRGRLDDEDRFSFEDLECHIPTAEELITKCSSLSIPSEAILNTKHISNMITSDYFSNVYNRWPRFPKLPENTTSSSYLAEIVFEKWQDKFNRNPTAEEIERIKYELKVFKYMDYSDYILILWDIVEFCNKEEILLGPGRGSIGGSMVAYILNITKINPMKYGMLFERFANQGRASTPLIFNE